MVEIGVLKIDLDGDVDQRTGRVNCSISVPVESSAIHKLSDEDVMGQPRYFQMAAGLIAFLGGCDLSGFDVGISPFTSGPLS